MVLHKMNDQATYSSYRGISLVAHDGWALVKIIARRLRLLRARGEPAGGTEWFPSEAFYH